MLRRFLVTPDEIAAAMVESVERDRREITVPWFPYRIVSLLHAIVPGLVTSLASRFSYHHGEPRV